MKEELKNLYYELYEGMIDKDLNKLNKLLSPDFSLIHMTGLNQSKNEFIQAISDNTLNYYSAHHEKIELVKKGNEVELIGQSKVKAKVFGGSVNTWRLQLNLKLEIKKGKYTIKEIVASTY